MMLLAIDVGNTNVTLGLFRGVKGFSKGGRSCVPSNRREGTLALIHSWRLATSQSSTVDEYGTKILDLLHYASVEKGEIKAIAMASVVPHISQVFSELSKKYFKQKLYIVGENLKISMPNLYENPKEVGADRIVNAMAAYAKFGAPCIVVDFGTATTFDCVTKKGEYAGGIIVPGPLLSAESLSLHTAKLPKVEMIKPERLIGKNTVASIQSGLYFGYLSLVDGILERLKRELGSGCRVAATGGLAPLVCADSKHVKKGYIVPDLTLEGIVMIFEKNQR